MTGIPGKHVERMEQLERFSPSWPVSETAWLASRLLRRQVVDVSAAEPVGRVVDLVFDPQSCQVMGLVIQPADEQRGLFAPVGRLFGRGRAAATVGLDHVISMDGDVVMLNTNPFRLTPSREMEQMPRLNAICEMAILTMRGTSLGTLADLLLEEQGTTIAGYVVSPSAAGEQALPPLQDLAPLAGELESVPTPRLRLIPASSHVRIGESLILLLSDIEPPQAEVVIVVPQEITERTRLKGA